MAAVMRMPTDQYARWLQETTAGMLATAPNGSGTIPAQYRAMGDYEPAPTDGQPVQPSTPLSWIRASVERVRREMRAEKAQREAERERRDALRKLRTRIAADFRYAVEHPPPLPYDIALAKRGSVPEVWQSDGGCPEPYSIALEAMRRRTKKATDN